MSEQHEGLPPKSAADSSASQTLAVIVHFLACVAQQQDTQSHFGQSYESAGRTRTLAKFPTAPVSGSMVK